MDVARPWTAVSRTLDGEVLVVLARSASPLTGRQVAARVGHGSQRGVAIALARLAEHGLVLREQAGRAHLHRLNEEHLAAPAVRTMAALRTELFTRMSALIATWELPPVHASVFGSTARGDGTTDSDIDVLLVRPDGEDDGEPRWRAQLEDLERHVFCWTGNRVSTIDVSTSELATAPPSLEAIERDAVDLAGVPAHRLRRISS